MGTFWKNLRVNVHNELMFHVYTAFAIKMATLKDLFSAGPNFHRTEFPPDIINAGHNFRRA